MISRDKITYLTSVLMVCKVCPFYPVCSVHLAIVSSLQYKRLMSTLSRVLNHLSWPQGKIRIKLILMNSIN